LLNHLYTNKTDLGWEIPDSYDTIILTGKEFNNFYPLFEPYRTFESLRTICKQVECDFLANNIGTDFLGELKSIEYSDDEGIATKQKIVIREVKKACAFKTIQLACDLLPVKFTGNGFTVLLSNSSTYDLPIAGDNGASLQQIEALKQSATNNATNIINNLITYLNTNASSELFNTYYTSPLYKSPTTEKQASINSKTQNFYM